MAQINLLYILLSVGNTTLSPQEYGPLAYLIGYVIRALYQKSKNCSRSSSPRNREIQVFTSSMKDEAGSDPYIQSISRGGLWTPISWLVTIAETIELVFRKYTTKERVTCLPVEKMVEEVLASSDVASLWGNVVENCEVNVSKECQQLCLENVIKLYLTVRCFSFAKDIIQKYNLEQGIQQKKALRKSLKKASEEQSKCK